MLVRFRSSAGIDPRVGVWLLRNYWAFHRVKDQRLPDVTGIRPAHENLSEGRLLRACDLIERVGQMMLGICLPIRHGLQGTA